MKIDKRHAYLIMLKNTAYAWRQMIFFLSLLSPVEIEAFLAWAELHLEEQREDFRTRFRPALNGLKFAAAGGSLDRSNNRDVQRFLGWSHKGHWLM